MARHAIPQVINDHLIPPDDTKRSLPTIQVGSQAWYTWLNEPTSESFAFRGLQGTLTARREQRHGTWYWYAYRTQDGHLQKVYLGKSEELTLVRLHEAAASLSAKSTTSPAISAMASQPSDAVARAPATKAPSISLLTTKLYVPPTRLNMVARPRLMERMDAGMGGKLTLIVAPAGWGKTTLLSAWHADASHRVWPFAWVSLEGGDNDPTRFWTYVIAALNMLHPGVGETSLAQLYTSPPLPLEAVLTSLLNTLAGLPTETVLVLDDYHLIETQPIHDALTFLLEHLPPNLHLVIASRVDPPLPLARLRARGTLTELRAANLRFTAEETAVFLTEVMGLPLSSEEVAALQARTEGWIAGLHLAALSLQGRENVADFIAAFTGSHRYVVDYLVEEVLLRQPETVQDFLLQTCLLDRLSGPLCDAVRERDDSQMLLKHLEHTNLFLIPLDDERQWYRYHHLFAEVLRNRLQQQQPLLVPELHRHASRWYEQHMLFDEAVTHALAVPDVEHAARLIEQYAEFSNFPSQFQVLLRWLNRLPDAFICTQPILCLMHAITLMLTHQLEQASARVKDAERCLQEEMPAERRRVLLSLIAAFRANLARLFGDYERCIPLAYQALDLMPEIGGMSLTRMFRPSTLVTAASAYLVDGNMTDATEQQVEATVASVRALGNLPTAMRSISNLARLQLLQGRLRQAALTIEQATQLVPKLGGLQTLLNGADYYIILGDLLREWNQLDKAEQHLMQGLELVREMMTADAEMITRGYLTLARLQQARGESSRALLTLNTFAQMAHQHGFAPILLAQGAVVRAQVELAQGNFASAMRWAESSGLSPSDELSYLHEQQYLTLARVRIAQGHDHPRGSFLQDALSLLARLLADAELKARMRSVIEILILRALALQALSDYAEALSTLERALILAAPEGYMRLFLDEGAPMLALLSQAQAHRITPGYVTALREAAGEQDIIAPHHSTSPTNLLIEPLTEREHEVLRLLMDGASNREIAHHLVLSVNTVKKHVYNICSKLEVQSRAQAIAKARNLNLL